MEASLNKVKFLTMDENDLNVWTLRITVNEAYEKYLSREWPQATPDAPIIKYLEEMDYKIFPKILCYRETSKKHVAHYHIRIGSTRWKTRKSLFDSIHKSFPFMKGQKCFSTKAVRVNGKKTSSLEKSITYISKERIRIYTRGYTQEALELFELIGSEWLDVTKMPIYKQIIHRYSITSEHHGHTVCAAVLAYYDDEGKGYPTYYNLTKILSNIKLEVDPKYRKAYLMGGAQLYDDMMHNLTYG